MSTRTLHIGADSRGAAFTLPLDFVTQTAAILARKRVGKTYTASVIAEELAEARIPFVVLDPTGAWWGLRSHYPVVIIGGAHGDVPLESTAGKVIADLVTEHPNFYIIDLSQTASDEEQDRFATEFAERLYRVKEKHRFPMHLLVDEADAFAPQSTSGGMQHRMVRAYEAIVRRGGIRGLGMTMITQRPASLSKGLLTQSEMLVVLQMTGPQDQDAIQDWVKRNGTKEQRDTMMASLASLQVGQAWVWSPSWLQCFEKISIRQRRTFNSSATPKPGEKILVPETVSVDLAKLGKQIADTVERAKDSDPEALHAKIRDLQSQLARRPAAAPAERIELKVPDADACRSLRIRLNEVESMVNAVAVTCDEYRNVVEAQAESLKSLRFELAGASGAIGLQLAEVSGKSGPALVREQVSASPKPVAHLPRTATAPAGSLPRAERALLTVLAQRFPNATSRAQLAILSGYSSTSSSFANAIGALRSADYISGSGDAMASTHQGNAALGAFEPLPVGHALREYWLNKLPKAESTLLGVLSNAYPHALTKERLSESSGYSVTSSSFANALGQLRTLELITRGTEIRASEHLFA